MTNNMIEVAYKITSVLDNVQAQGSTDVIQVAGFPVTPDTNLSRFGEYNDIRYKISNHGRHKSVEYFDHGSENGTWCYYVYIPEYALPTDQFEKFWLPVARDMNRSSGIPHPCYDYDSADWSDCDWHGGVTWYKKLGGIDRAPRVVEIGCDYAHLRDAERGYNYDYVEVMDDAKHTINLLCKLYPFYSSCRWTGKYMPRDMMVEHEGKLYTEEGLAEMLKYHSDSQQGGTGG